MGLFDLFKRPDINQGVNEYNSTPGAVLVDVRTPQEYREGHIPDSRNVPLQEIGSVGLKLSTKETHLFLYCHSGARSAQAAGVLRRMGYTSIRNIGGISAWKGTVER